MLKKNILLVTFPVDLGNRTLESNQHEIFKNDMDFFRFAKDHSEVIDQGSVKLWKSLLYRFKSTLALRKTVRLYTKAGKTILFNGLSPALFSFGTWKSGQTAIVFDWTRTLYPYVLGQNISKNLVFKVHRKVLKKCPKFLCWTDAIVENLNIVYEIERSCLFKVRAPFLVEIMNIAPRKTIGLPKVLFIGGDLKRKGGDILLQAWNSDIKNLGSLTMMTNDKTADVEGVNFLSGVKYGSEIHRNAFKEHDILVLPTRMDAYPQVIGEAAAAGLAVITTKFALGAKEVVKHDESGYIANSPEDCIILLQRLLEDISLIDKFKMEGYKYIHEKFSKDKIRHEYLEILKIPHKAKKN